MYGIRIPSPKPEDRLENRWVDGCVTLVPLCGVFIVFAVFFLVGFFMLQALTDYWMVESILKKEGVRCQGKIVAWKTKPFQGRGTRYYPTIEFSDENGVRHFIEGMGYRKRPNIEVLPLAYARSNPDIYLVDDDSRHYHAYVLPWILGGLSLMLLALGAGCVGMVKLARGDYEPRRRRKRKRKTKESKQEASSHFD